MTADQRPEMGGDPLLRLGAAWGIEPSYRDNAGVVHAAGRDAILAVLRAMGAPVESERDAIDALRSDAASRSARRCAPVAVAWGGRLPAISCRTAHLCWSAGHLTGEYRP